MVGTTGIALYRYSYSCTSTTSTTSTSTTRLHDRQLVSCVLLLLATVC